MGGKGGDETTLPCHTRDAVMRQPRDSGEEAGAAARTRDVILISTAFFLCNLDANGPP